MDVLELRNKIKDELEALYLLWDQLDYYRVFGHEEDSILEPAIHNKKVRDNMATWTADNLQNKTYQELNRMHQRYIMYITKADKIKEDIIVGKKNMKQRYSVYSSDPVVRKKLEAWINMIAEEKEKRRKEEYEQRNPSFKL